MWSLVNRTPYAADRGWIRDKHGAEHWIVAVKATYDIAADGTLRASPEQVPVFGGPIVDDASGELLYETDLGPTKSGTDVLLIGNAHSPTGAPVTELPIGFRVGGLTRTATVYGDRVWRKRFAGYSAGRPDSFVRMPLGYSRALGGDNPADANTSGNPIGRGIVPPRGDRFLMPNLEDSERRLRSPAERPPVAAFGPVPDHWPWRLRHAGTYDKHWFDHVRPLLPQDVDDRSWRIAPPAQQLNSPLLGGEPVSMVNLTRPGFCTQSRLQFELPRLRLGFETRFYDGSVEHGRSAIYTVILEPEWPRVSIVHHLSLPCHPKVNLLDRTIIFEKRQALHHADVVQQPERSS